MTDTRGHSLASATVLKYLEAGGVASGIALICGMPPSGNGPMTIRFVRRDLSQAWSILRGFAFKTATREPDVARRLFFDEDTPASTIGPLLPRLAADSKVGIYLQHFDSNLPSKATGQDGRASWLAGAALAPSLVLGATRDYVVDREAEGVVKRAVKRAPRFAAFRGRESLMAPTRLDVACSLSLTRSSLSL